MVAGKNHVGPLLRFLVTVSRWRGWKISIGWVDLSSWVTSIFDAVKETLTHIEIFRKIF